MKNLTQSEKIEVLAILKPGASIDDWDVDQLYHDAISNDEIRERVHGRDDTDTPAQFLKAYLIEADYQLARKLIVADYTACYNSSESESESVGADYLQTLVDQATFGFGDWSSLDLYGDCADDLRHSLGVNNL